MVVFAGSSLRTAPASASDPFDDMQPMFVSFLLTLFVEERLCVWKKEKKKNPSLEKRKKETRKRGFFLFLAISHKNQKPAQKKKTIKEVVMEIIKKNSKK